MNDLKLWEQLKNLKKNYEWIDLSHSLGEDTPHWAGWPKLKTEVAASLDSSLFNAHYYTTVGQYGTHVDAPSHMVKNSRNLDQISVEEMIYPLCIIDKCNAVKENPDYILTKQDILDWESENGKIPEGAFVAFRSDWSKRSAKEMDNLDSDGNRHFPGWSLESLEFLVDERNIGSIGHETSDTEAPIHSSKSNYEVEYYILSKDRIQIELLTNLDKCPNTGAIIFCTFPKVKDASGYPARCFALCPKNK